MTPDFAFKPLPWNIEFGVDALQRLPERLDALGFRRALVLTTIEQTSAGQRLAELLGNRCIGHFDRAVMHVPVATIDSAMEMAASLDADCSVAIGGGSTTGLGKMLALKAGLANIVVPTSYAGSEMTNIWGMTEHGRKTTGCDDTVVPNLTLYDPRLTLSLPAKFAASSGMNAIAQAAVNIASPTVNPMVEILALEAVRRLSGALPRILASPTDLDARADALYGACLAGSALGTGETGLHHRLCHTFGGTFNTPHAETHTVLLPYSIAFNAHAVPAGTARLADALGCDNAANGIYQLARSMGAPSSLAELGVQEADIEQAVAVTLATPIANPEPVTADNLRVLLSDALAGRMPATRH